jgi:hypothetical protein
MGVRGLLEDRKKKRLVAEDDFTGLSPILFNRTNYCVILSEPVGE